MTMENENEHESAAFSGPGIPRPYSMRPSRSTTIGSQKPQDASQSFVNSRFPQGMRPALVDPNGRVHFLENPPAFAPGPFVPVESTASQTTSPPKQRPGRLTSDHLRRLELENRNGGSQKLASRPQDIITKSVDEVALPSEMPIGSLVHLQTPPKWGVLKISNVSLHCQPSLSNTLA